MKVRRLVALLTAGMMVTALTATTAMAESGAESVAEAAADGVISAGAGAGKGYKIAVIQQHQTNAFQIAVSEAAEAAAEELGCELNLLSADQDAAKQISQIEQCVVDGYDAILFEPVDPDGLGAAAKAAADEGVVVINIISACTDWEANGIAALSCGDNVTAGETEMQAVADLAIERGTGARGLRAILESAMTKLMFEIPSRHDVAKLEITPECIRGTGECKYTLLRDLPKDGPLSPPLEEPKKDA